MALRRSILTPRAVNWRSRYAVGLSSLWLPGYGYAASPDLVGRRKMITSTSNYGTGPFGRTWGPGGAQQIYSGTDFLTNRQAFSLLLVWYHDYANSFERILRWGSANGDVRTHNSTSVISFVIRAASNNEIFVSGVTTGQWHALLWTHSASADASGATAGFKAFYDGSAAAETIGGQVISTSALSAGNDGNNWPKISMLAGWHRELTPSEAIDISGDPSVLLAPREHDDFAVSMALSATGGPYCVKSSEIYVPGVLSHETYMAGITKSNIYTSGAEAAGVC